MPHKNATQSIVQASWNVSYKCVIIICVGNFASRTVFIIIIIITRKMIKRKKLDGLFMINGLYELIYIFIEHQ